MKALGWVIAGILLLICILNQLTINEYKQAIADYKDAIAIYEAEVRKEKR